MVLRKIIQSSRHSFVIVFINRILLFRLHVFKSVARTRVLWMVLLSLCDLLSKSNVFKNCQCERGAGKRRLLRRLRKKKVLFSPFANENMFLFTNTSQAFINRREGILIINLQMSKIVLTLKKCEIVVSYYSLNRQYFWMEFNYEDNNNNPLQKSFEDAQDWEALKHLIKRCF